MIKQLTVFFVLFLLACSVFAQNQKIDSLDRLAVKASSDTQRINLSIQKVKALFGYNHDSAIALDKRLIEESKKINYYRGELDARSQLGSDYSLIGNFSAALEQLKAMRKIIKPSPDSLDLAIYYSIYGLFYSMQSKYDSAIQFFEQSIKMIEANNIYTNTLGNDYNNIAIAYQQLSNFPVALSYYQKILKIAEQQKNEPDAAYAYVNMALVFSSLGKNKEAEETFIKSIALAKKNELRDVELYSYSNLAALLVEEKEWQQCYDLCMKAADLGAKLGDKAIVASSLSRGSIALAKKGELDSALILNTRAMPIADSSGQSLNIYQVYTDRANILRMMGRIKEAIAFYEKGFLTMKSGDFYGGDFAAHYKELSECYEKEGDYAKALSATRKGFMISDSVRNKDNGQKSTELAMNYEFDKKQELAKLEQDKKDAVAKRAKLIQYFVIAGLAGVVLLVLAIALIQYKNSKQKQKANLLLERQKQKVEVTLTDLKSAQAQLVQSEKMASLGELTAGIAHEIQNPLNFVNNFSEVNKELLEELKEEADKGNIDEIKMIANDLIENEKKINQHGKRADAIVKGMLQHSRLSVGTKEPILINALAEEYLRLSYHGLRAKDKNFNAFIQTDFDESIKKIDIVPQDIGRVLLNLYNNAFYAVSERRKVEGIGYEPTVSVGTKKSENQISITVSDNGNGIPQNIIDKIFQPFFTTKPSGEGTGLGLSISYDIIKAHGGELKVTTKDKEGSAFVIILPVKNSTS